MLGLPFQLRAITLCFPVPRDIASHTGTRGSFQDGSSTASSYNFGFQITAITAAGLITNRFIIAQVLVVEVSD